MKKATLGGGCYWYKEAVFQRLQGTSNLRSGYMGGHVSDPTYRDVASGESGHAEVLQMDYDEDVITYQELLEVFWTVHDPTTINRQGFDRGPQYRSVIFFHEEE